MGTTVVGDARVAVPFGDRLGPGVRRAFERALAADAAWTELEDGLRYDVDGGHVIYRPELGDLEIVAELREEIEVEGRAQATVEGVTRGTLEREGVGTYYDDNWRGRTVERAQEEARARAEVGLTELARRRVRDERQRAERAREASLQADAEADARAQLAATTAERHDILSSRARDRLDRVAVECRAAVHRVLAVSYREAIVEYARDNGAANLVCHEAGNIIEIEFEIER